MRCSSRSHDWQMYAWSVGFTIVGAAIFTLTRTRDHRVPQEALIGIVYVAAAAGGILLLSRSAEGNEELKRTLVIPERLFGESMINQAIIASITTRDGCRRIEVRFKGRTNVVTGAK